MVDKLISLLVDFFGTSFSTTIEPYLRRTLVRSVILFSLSGDQRRKKLRGGHANLRQILWQK